MKTHSLTLPDFQARAAHEGRLLQHREVLRPQPPGFIQTAERNGRWFWVSRFGRAEPIYLPYAPGDKLWVRETFAVVPRSAYAQSIDVPQAINPDDEYSAAIFKAGWSRARPGAHWRSPVAMPRWASRTTLVVRAVRIERLQEMREEDAKAEGFTEQLHPNDDPIWPSEFASAVRACRGHWNATHGPGEQWEDNPWVIVLDLEKETE